MTEINCSSADDAVNRFLQRFDEDLAGGSARALSEYQGLFPGHEEEMARAYAALYTPEGAAVSEAGPFPTAPAEAAPAPIGEFRVIRRLGQGGMGTVWLCQHPRVDRKVAVKVLNAPVASPSARERFRREADAAVKVRHPHVCPVEDFGEDGGLPFLVMAYIEGTTLASLIPRSWDGASSTQMLRSGLPDPRPTAAGRDHGDDCTDVRSAPMTAVEAIDGRLSPAAAAQITERVARALQACHD